MLARIAALSVLLVACGQRSVDPLTQPGQTWLNTTPEGGEALRLLDSGNYVSRRVSDYRGETTTSGRWSKKDNVITLRPDEHQMSVRELLEIESNGCRLLAQRAAINPDGTINPWLAHLREGERCELGKHGYERKL
jgi:hypothetical protein